MTDYIPAEKVRELRDHFPARGATWGMLDGLLLEARPVGDGELRVYVLVSHDYNPGSQVHGVFRSLELAQVAVRPTRKRDKPAVWTEEKHHPDGQRSWSWKDFEIQEWPALSENPQEEA